MPPPKTSLFKQKIKQVRNQQKTYQSFPLPVKIVDLTPLPQIPPHQQQPPLSHPMLQIKQKETKQQKGWGGIQSILKSGLGEHEQDMSKIDSQNWKQINAMSQSQIEQYGRLLQEQLPAGLIKKLKICKEKKEKRMDEQELPEKDFTKKENANMIEQKTQQKVEQEENKQINSLDGFLINIKTSKLQFAVNADHQKLIEKSGSKQFKEWVTFQELQSMIESENNQTMSVASQIFIRILKKFKNFPQTLMLSPDFPSLLLFDGGGITLHQYRLFEDLYRTIIQSIMHKLKSNRFRSCWLQLYTAFIYFVLFFESCIRAYQRFRIIGCKLKEMNEKKQMEGMRMKEMLDRGESNRYMESIVEFIKNTIMKKLPSMSAQVNKDHEKLEQFNVNIYDPLQLRAFLAPLFDTSSCQIQNLKAYLSQLDAALLLPNSSTTLLTIIILEQTDHEENTPSQDYQYKYLTIFQEIQYRIYMEYLKGEISDRQIIEKSLTNILFKASIEIVESESTHKFSKSYTKQVLIIIKQLLQNIFNLISLPALSQQNSNYSQMFKKLFILKTIKPDHFYKYLQSQSCLQIQTKSHSAFMLPILTLTDTIQGITGDPVYDLKSYKIISDTLQFLSEIFSKSSSSEEIDCILRNNLVCLLLIQTIDIFKLGFTENIGFNEILMDRFLRGICQTISSQKQKIEKLWKLLSTEKIKEIIQMYNYDSFGNYPFTRLILFLVALAQYYCQYEIQLHFLQEIIVRYPYLFYYALHPSEHYGPSQFYQNNSILSSTTSGTQIVMRNQIETEKQSIWESLKVKGKVEGSRMLKKNEVNYFIKYLGI